MKAVRLNDVVTFADAPRQVLSPNPRRGPAS